MNTDSSKKIINNCDVLQLIFRYLDVEEHLKLIKICPQFAYAVVHGVWRLSNKTLYILRTFGGHFRLRYNAVDDVRTEGSLTPKAIHIILQHISMYIHKMYMNNIRSLENIISLKYHHLTELSFFASTVHDIHLQQVAKNCINLQSLSLLDISRSGHYKPNIRPIVFGEMKALNKLEFDYVSFTAWNYFDVQQLFCLAHLKTLVINISIRDSNDNNENNENSAGRVYNIENLTIGELPCLQSANVCFIEDLIRFKNLTKLSIKLTTRLYLNLDDNHLTQINNACLKLRELSLAGCYMKFTEFPRMNHLMDLTFKRCACMRLENFDEIFRKLKLKSLSLMHVRMIVTAKDISSYNFISNTLETLTIKHETDGYDRKVVETFFNRQHKFENVFKVRLEMGCGGSAGSTELCFSHNFPYLQELIMSFFYISSEDILHLKHLKVLQFDIFYEMSWSYLEILFKHPTLTHITITPINWEDFGYVIFPRSYEGLTTKLEYLSLPSVMFQSDSNFWSSFQQRNKLLKLEIVKCVKIRYDDFDY